LNKTGIAIWTGILVQVTHDKGSPVGMYSNMRAFFVSNPKYMNDILFACIVFAGGIGCGGLIGAVITMKILGRSTVNKH